MAQSERCKIASLERRLAEVTAERDDARKAVSFGRDAESFDWAVLGKIDDLERRLAESEIDYLGQIGRLIQDRDAAIQRAEAAEADNRRLQALVSQHKISGADGSCDLPPAPSTTALG